jgi:hypothetical protein
MLQKLQPVHFIAEQSASRSTSKCILMESDGVRRRDGRVLRARERGPRRPE